MNLGTFSPAPATLRGPAVVLPVRPVLKGEVDVREEGKWINPAYYESVVRLAAQQAQFRPGR
jgi:hypothetical protein